jgi:hypothetical protein
MTSHAAHPGGSGNPPQPPPGGGEKRKPGSSSGGRNSKKKVRAAKRRGRPLQNMERMQIMGIWYQLSGSARRSLYETLGEMLGETPAVASAEAGVSGNDESQRPRRMRVWEREVLRDVPLFAEFGHMTAPQRRSDSRDVPRLLSIAQGVVHRGRNCMEDDGIITGQIVANLQNPDAMSRLYLEASSSEEGQGDSKMDGE